MNRGPDYLVFGDTSITRNSPGLSDNSCDLSREVSGLLGTSPVEGSRASLLECANTCLQANSLGTSGGGYFYTLTHKHT